MRSRSSKGKPRAEGHAAWVRVRLAAGLALLGAVLGGARVLAMDRFEIQVYQGEHNEPGQASVELHSNYTLHGRQEPDYAGETVPHRAWHFTLEPAMGVTDWLELGAYLQTQLSPAQGAEFGGWKLRSKLIAPERWGLPIVLGINVELGRVPRSVEEEGWANEFRPILGMELGRWAFTFNPLFGFALTGPEAGKPDFEPAGKIRWNSNLGFAVGIEHYSALGRFDQGFASVRQQEHLTFVALDLEPREGEPPSAWELNLGVGRSLTATTPQRWIVKMILGRAF